MAKKLLTLKEWILETGEIEAAKLIKVDRSTVRHWRRGYCLPRATQMFLIHKYSHGRVTYAEMIETYEKAKLKNKVTA